MDLSLWCVIQRSRNFTKHSKLWTFLVSHWVRGPDILQKIQSCGPFSLAQALEGAPAQLQRRSQVSLAGGGADRIPGGGDKPPYKLPLNFTQIKKCQGSSLGGLKFFQGGGDPRYATGPTPTSNVLDALHEVPINIYQLLTVFC